MAWLVALSFWHFGGHWSHLLTSLVTWGAMVSFVPLVARLPGAWFRPCFGWLAPGGGWFRLVFPLLGLGWLWL